MPNVLLIGNGAREHAVAEAIMLRLPADDPSVFMVGADRASRVG